MRKNKERLIRLKRYREIDKSLKLDLVTAGRNAMRGIEPSNSKRRRVNRLRDLRDKAFDHLRSL
jgi:hypothetical protein